MCLWPFRMVVLLLSERLSDLRISDVARASNFSSFPACHYDWPTEIIRSMCGRCRLESMANVAEAILSVHSPKRPTCGLEHPRHRMKKVQVMRDAELKGLAYIVCCNLIFVIMSAIIKVVATTIPPLEISVFRHALSILFLLFILPRSGESTLRLFFLTKEHFVRSLFGYAHFVLFILCVSKLPLAAASAVSYTSPIWSLLLSVFVLKERAAVAPIIGLTFGLLGMLAIVQPSVSSMTVWIVVGLIGASLSSLDLMMVRHISGTETPERIALSFALWSSAIGLPLAIPGWVWPNASIWPLLFLIGALGMLVQVMLARGYTVTRLSRGTVFGDFIGVPASLTIGWVCFAEFPTPLMWVGSGLILCGSSMALVERRIGN